MDETSRPKLNKPLAIGAVVVALILGLVVGGSLDIGKRLFGGPDPETVASSALQSMRAQNRLVPFVARYVSVVSSRQERFGGLVSSERTLILPGDVRYELDLAKLGPEDVQWDAGSSTLSVTLPEIEVAGPEVDLAAAREYGEGGVLSVVTDADQALDRNNRARAVADLRKQAQAAVPMRLAREAGRQAVERSFALPLQAAGFDNAKVIARYPTEGSPVTKPLDRSRAYNDVLDEAATRR
jgi:hypothetical protein